MEFTKEDLTEAISKAAKDAVIEEVTKVNDGISKMKEDLSETVTKQLDTLKKGFEEKEIHKDVDIQINEPEPDYIKNSGAYFNMVIKAAQDGNARQTLGRALEVHLKTSAGINTIADSEGGFLPTIQIAEQIQANAYKTGQLVSRATKMPLGQNSNVFAWNEVVENDRTTTGSYFGALAVRVQEGIDGDRSKFRFKRRELPVAKMMVLLPVTDEALEDSVQLSGLINEAVPNAFGKKLDDEILRGTGAGQAQGILGHPGTLEIAKETTQTTATIIRQNVNKMFDNMNPEFLSNAIFAINPHSRQQLREMTISVGTGGSAIFMPEGNIAGQPFSTLLGHEIVPVNACSALGTPGDLIFGDFSQYILVEKGGIKAAESMHVLFDSGQREFRFTWRVSGGPRLSNVIIPEHGGANDRLAAFVTLATRP